uniref:Uncharacterized protein n=1 Tax=Populus alba TaxID=43335 RepID=A0A4U5QLD4_POPAL|nr:hypothetical protein D5086_0000072410 [Populus alba]
MFPLISPPPPVAATQPPLSPSSSSQPTLSPPSPTLSPTQSPLPVDPDFQPEDLCVVLPLSPLNLHPMTTRSKNGISKRKAYSASVQFVASSQISNALPQPPQLQPPLLQPPVKENREYNG